MVEKSLTQQLLAEVRERVGPVKTVRGPKLRIQKDGVTLAYVKEGRRGTLRVDSRSRGRAFNVRVTSPSDVRRAAAKIGRAAEVVEKT